MVRSAGTETSRIQRTTLDRVRSQIKLLAKASSPNQSLRTLLRLRTAKRNMLVLAKRHRVSNRCFPFQLKPAPFHFCLTDPFFMQKLDVNRIEIRAGRLTLAMAFLVDFGSVY